MAVSLGRLKAFFQFIIEIYLPSNFKK